MVANSVLIQLAKALGGMPVLSTRPRSPAARAGIRYGDVVLSVNGRPTPTAGDYIVATQVRRDGMVAVIFRDGAELTIELVYDRDPDAAPDLERAFGLANES